jgi:hypothetical protein
MAAGSYGLNLVPDAAVTEPPTVNITVNLAASATVDANWNLTYGQLNVNGDSSTALDVTGGLSLMGCGPATTINAPIIGNGTITLNDDPNNSVNTCLNIGGSVGPEVTINDYAGDAGPQNTISVANGADFAGTIQLGGDGDDFVNLGSVSATSYTYTNNDEMTFYNGNNVVDTLNIFDITDKPFVVYGEPGSVRIGVTAQSTPPEGATVLPIYTPPLVGATSPDNYNIADSTSGLSSTAAGETYTGPVAGLTSEFVYLTADQVSITAEIPNVFIQLGSTGNAPSIGGINVSAANGNNVLDSYANSSFLTDGSGTDQNYVDTRGATANQWDTVVNFHSGDNVTMWGVTASDFKLDWIGQQGAAGYTGITGVFTHNGSTVESAFTLAGISSNAGVTVSYDTINGTPYASIHAV